MSVSAIGNAATYVPSGVEPRPPHQESGDGRSDDVTGSRTTESDGARRVVLARGGETETDRRDETDRDGDAAAGVLGDGRRGRNGAAAEATVGVDGRDGEGGHGGSDDEESETGPEQLTDDEEQVVREMKARDIEVRAHEMAHVAAGGAHVTGGPSYSYQQGPDGKRYAVGGEVGIDTSAEEDPQATIAKMAQVRAAAMAPAEPSGADRAVAAAAAATAAQARAELVEERTEETEEARGEAEGSDGAEGIEGAQVSEAEGVGEAGPATSSVEPSSTITPVEGAADAGSIRQPAAPEPASSGGEAAGPGFEQASAGESHRHAGGGVCPDCVGARYGAAGAAVPTPSLDVAA